MTEDRVKARVVLARRHLIYFTQLTYPSYQRTPIHDLYSGALNAFAEGRISKLIITMPPQHGKSELSSRRLPAYMLGKAPDKKIAIASYAQSFARKFGRDVRRIMQDRKYSYIFPATRLADFVDKGYTNSVDYAEVVGRGGSLLLAGRGSGLTGMTVDTLILDDLYKNAEEANSPIIRASVIEWYKTVADTRLHNDSQQLIAFTRWHQEDLVGWLESQDLVDELTERTQLNRCDSTRWLRLNFPALKIGEPYDLDKRSEGQALWPARHSRERLLAKQKQDPELFGSLYQGDPKPSEGLLYQGGLSEYDYMPEIVTSRWSYTDTADEGSDFLCSICAMSDGTKIYITDVLYTQDGQEITEPLCAKMFTNHFITDAYIESNAGGRAFARNVAKLLIEEGNAATQVRWFAQTKNKEARIITNAAQIRQDVLFPRGWRKKWPLFAKALLEFRKNFGANTHDDAADALTGTLEKSPLISPFGFAL